MLNKAKHKTRCKCIRRKKERKRSIHGDDNNVLMKEFKPFNFERNIRALRRSPRGAKTRREEREKVTESLGALFLPHLGRTFLFSKPLIQQ